MEGRTSMPEIDSLPVISAWLGGELSYLEKLCLTSMVQVGHKTILYCYTELRDVPDGVELRDADEVMREDDFIRYSNGSYALGSNLFRYQLFSKYPCIWVDTDMLLLKKIEPCGGYVFGWEDKRYLNTAVLSLPQDSPILSDIHHLISSAPFFAPWWSDEQSEIQKAAVQNGAALPLSELPWATSGPKLVTYLADKHEVTKFARSPGCFYPIHWKDYQLPFLAGEQIDQKLNEDTIGVHFWNHMLGDLKRSPHPNSFVAQQCRKFEIPIHTK
jgi:Alpha 1,4-glycosyltransferase conserved region